MELRPLGRTGVQVSSFCLGAMMFGAWGNPDHDESIRIIHAALDAGINFIDTADVYGAGESEEIVGKALVRGRRDDVVLATKFHNPMGADPNRRGNSRRWIMRAVEDSLRRLNTDWIDLYQVHRPDPSTDIEETLSALSDLVHQGKVRYLGSSTFPASQIAEAQWTARDRRLQRFVTEQPPYSILVRGVEADVLPTCARHGLAVMSYSPLAGGWLSGRWRKGTGQQASSRASRLPERFDLANPYNQRKLDAVEELAQLADQAGLTLIQLAIGFAKSHPAITSALIGPRTMEQLQTQLAAASSWPTTCSTASTRSSRPAPRSIPPTAPSTTPRSRPQPDAAARGASNIRGVPRLPCDCASDPQEEPCGARARLLLSPDGSRRGVVDPECSYPCDWALRLPWAHAAKRSCFRRGPSISRPPTRRPLRTTGRSRTAAPAGPPDSRGSASGCRDAGEARTGRRQAAVHQGLRPGIAEGYAGGVEPGGVGVAQQVRHALGCPEGELGAERP
jgi:aryl-alcohol dehydrogenase-like predicted oxidoreductase